MNLVKLSLVAAIAAGAALATPQVRAQEWPTGTVKVVVPFGAGSTPDSLARVVTERLQQKLGQNFVIENRPGASGNTGTAAVAKADPDGATLGVSIVGPLAINTLLFSNLPYDPSKDITPITILAAQPSVLVVSNNLGVSSVAELLALIKKDPGKYNYGSIGNGSLSHLSMESLAAKSGVKLVHVPFQGSPQAVTALIRNDVQIAVLPAASVVPQGEAGQLKMLAVSSAKRSSLLPNLPTLKESDIPDVEADAWVGLIAPAKTPEPMVAKIRQEVQAVLAEPATRERLRGMFMEAIGNSPDEFRGVIRAELQRWEPVIRAGNIKIN